ncbi:MAG TPA: DUF1836 domain-containing protein [Candidatus Jeotgalibaca pullicola]|nr:DUF1836 domain-containing protein [Candidatus Jeotgalibaca pullicola]
MHENEVLHYQQDLTNLKLIRWNELPNFGVYSDQVLTIIESQLSFLSSDDQERIITPAMINNYVKLGLIERPIKKKYYQLHIAKLIVITLLKQVLPLTDVQKGMSLQISVKGEKVAYDSFCDELEQSFHNLFSCLGKEIDFSFTINQIRNENIALKMVTLSLASKLLTQKIIEFNGLNQSNTERIYVEEKGAVSFEK